MPDDETNSIQVEVDEALAQRDAIRRELADLRARLCRELGMLRQNQDPKGRLA